MSWHHFLDINQNRLLEDLNDIHPTNQKNENWHKFYQKYPYTHQVDTMLDYLHQEFNQEKSVEEYWKYRVRKYISKLEHSQQIYPLIYSTDTLIQAHQFDINYFDGLRTVDTLKLYEKDYMTEFEIEASMKGNWSDGIEMDVVWNTKENKESLDSHNKLIHRILESGKEIDRLGELDPLWKLLDEESCIQRQLVCRH